MAADILVWKKKGQKFTAKIAKGMANGHTPDACSIIVNMKNYKDLALFFSDLKYLWGAPVDKAYEEYKSEEQQWPF